MGRVREQRDSRGARRYVAGEFVVPQAAISSSGGFGAHDHWVLGAEGDFGLRDYGVGGEEVEAPALGYGG